MAEFPWFLVPVLVALYFLVSMQLGVYRKRIHFLEVKVDALLKRTGIEFDDTSLVPAEVHQAVKAGHRLKAIRLYRKMTGAELKKASEVVNDLLSSR
ncbi:hypothetical protein CWE12_03130 [Aliidiomarina sedimenti]|uniref:Ribosomal protein L7/L12 C-terminal domain-containing protein n=1 Tax=Aliidiomarina sedimenti TaxID=1933879 RepID=A0ABY0C3B8_9GAMM|nr:hypothetical protein [Aliidiomarina sedimenti]RUO31998.1 hypothetical protein CWE12_03130 [Aliidiomarina sedimenti]